MSKSGHHEVVIIDNGSHRIRAGLSGDDEPKVIFPNVVGRPIDGAGGEFVGRKAQAKLDALNTKSPIEKGVVSNWDDMEKVWQYTYSEELKMSSSDLPLLITERPGTPKENKEKMAQILFEKFKVPALFSGIQGVLSLYASGRMTGMVLDSGEDVTHAVPVFSGYAIPDGVLSMDVGGSTVTQCLGKLLQAKGQTFSSASDMEALRQMKEAVCYVAPNYDLENAKSESDVSQSYKLPDGREVKLAREAYECTEVLFKPAKCAVAGPGLLELIQQSVSKCEVDVRKELLRNTILAGGNTMFRSLSDRLKTELTASVNTPVKVVAHQERDQSVWIGGSILACQDAFQGLTVTMKDYEESGPQAIHKKF